MHKLFCLVSSYVGMRVGRGFHVTVASMCVWGGGEEDMIFVIFVVALGGRYAVLRAPPLQGGAPW